MAPQRRGFGRRPPPAPSDVANGFSQLYPDQRVSCKICDTVLSESLEDHLVHYHAKVSMEEYKAAYEVTTPPYVPPPPPPPVELPSVSASEAKSHPGGHHAVVIEKSLELDSERELYRQHVADLVDAGYLPGYLLASVAHYMILAARMRGNLERVQRESHGMVGVDTEIKSLDDFEKRIGSWMGELEKARREADRIRREEDKARREEDPTYIVEEQLQDAERWVQQHMGEFVERCPSPACGQMLVAPALPHWAFAPIQLSSGKTDWMVWSKELWSLVCDGALELWAMAYTLRTSPEAIYITAQRRGEMWPAHIDIPRQEQLLSARVKKDDAAMVVRFRELKPRALPAGVFVEESQE